MRQKENQPRPLRGWYSPYGLVQLYKQNIKAGDKALADLDYELLQDKQGLNLRDYQVKAIQKTEQAIAAGAHNVLLAMATGTGKTRTVLGMIYRFLKTGRYHRILFLVDRTALGQQAEGVFKEVKLEDLQTLDNIYNIKNLDDQLIDKETSIHISTVQGMIKRVLYNDGEQMPAVADYDLIIIDEAHRGYTLDKEMGDKELAFRDQRDYQSKYQAVVEYFDADKIALTATPALHTVKLFGNPVFKYTYREAVIDGYLVDHDAPLQLQTKLSTEGIHYHKGDTIAVYNPVTHEIENSELLDDELNFGIEDFNKAVINPSFNETVLREIAKHLDPSSPEISGKTLIYAVDDDHADAIVNTLRKIYEDQGLDNDAIMKITGSIGGGNKKKVQEAIKRFKNEMYPSIVVTVDLLTTGIDVPEITNIVFMRRVKSRILFEQMLGRATRLCPKLKKSHFNIYDPVGTYDSLEEVNTMKPVVSNPNQKFGDIIAALEGATEKEQAKYYIDQFVAKLQRSRRRDNPDFVSRFTVRSKGLSPAEFVAAVEKLQDVDKAVAFILEHKDVLQVLDGQEGYLPPKVVISQIGDEYLGSQYGYGKGQSSRDYLEEFTEYIKTHQNEVAALNIICTRPADLTSKQLKELRQLLDAENFTDIKLNRAISELTNAEAAADIISIIRRCALGSQLMSHEERIRRAVLALRGRHKLTQAQENWLKRIEAYLMTDFIINKDIFDEAQILKNNGGYKRANKIFNNQLDDYIRELNGYLYDDGGRTA